MNNNGYRVVVDAGHGGADPGAVSGNLKEKDLNLKAANYMYNRFKELGIPVAITRDTDKTLTRAERLNTMRNTFGNDSKVLVLSNHINAGGGEGAEVVYPLRSNGTLANNILNEIGAKGQIKRKTYQRVLPENPSRDYYYIMRETPNTEALLIEYGFIDNPRDQQKLVNNIENYAEAVVKAVSEYIGVPYMLPGSSEIGDMYTVQRGDTLYSIARKYNTTVSALQELNNLSSPNLSIGQILQIPQREIIDEVNTYTIKEGDSLYTVANRYNVNVQDLIEYNNLPSISVPVGTVIKIPGVGDINNENLIYTVKPNDTLYRIANTYNISVNDLIKANNLTNTILTIGQELIIPKVPVKETDYVVYEVQRGDTLYSIARKYNTTVNAIKSYNNLLSDTLSIGQTIQIPVIPVNQAYEEYVIQRGDTLYSIARKYNKTINDILAINNDLSSILSIGQVIKIPR